MVKINVVILCYISVVLLTSCGAKAELVDLIGRRLNSGGRELILEEPIPVTKDHSPALQLIKQFGYPAETHEITTSDGYILTVHRIPYGIKGSSNNSKIRPAVILHHGILGSSDMWLLRGPKDDLAFILADDGYDVWIPNGRGNFYSRRHITLDPDRDKKFWDFSFHEMGYYDLPATIDHVLNVTNQRNLFYIGHSMGTTIFFVLTSTRPEYNSKIRLFQGLAPAVFIIHKPNPLQKILIANVGSLQQSFKTQGVYELLPLRRFTGRLGRALCHKNAPTQSLCLAGVFLVAGVDYQQLNSSLLPEVFDYFPAGASVNQFVHFGQNILSRGFRYMDYGEPENIVRYQQRIPPEYDLQNVVTPVALFYGDGDFIVRREDAEMLASKLPNLVGVFRVPFPYFNHLDFLWSSDSKTLLYDQLLVIMNKYRE